LTLATLVRGKGDMIAADEIITADDVTSEVTSFEQTACLTR